MPEAGPLAVVAATFLLAGCVKGVVGLGLPSVSLAILTVVFDLHTAMALLLAPSFVTNVWQGVVGGHARAVFSRVWLFLVMATVTVWIGALALTRVDAALLTALLGVLLAAYGAVSLGGLRFNVPKRHEAWVGPALGSINGVLTGMTGSFMVPGIFFLQGIGLSRDMLVQAMGMLFSVSTAALAIAMSQANLVGVEQGVLSVAGIPPAILGMVLGQRIRSRLSEQAFRRAFFVAILLLGLYIVGAAIAKA